MFALESALEHTCAEFRDQVTRGQITAAERDLLIDGAILLAIHLEALLQDAHAGTLASWMPASRPGRLAA
jgi:hypothetical protein